MTIADKLALLEQTKEAQRVKLGLPKGLPFSRYHEFFEYKFDPRYLFLNGEQGVWFDPSDLKTMYQDVSGATPVTKDGDPVALIRDKSGNGNHATQTTAAARPIYRTDGKLHWLEFDGVDDFIYVKLNQKAFYTLWFNVKMRGMSGRHIIDARPHAAAHQWHSILNGFTNLYPKDANSTNYISSLRDWHGVGAYQSKVELNTRFALFGKNSGGEVAVIDRFYGFLMTQPINDDTELQRIAVSMSEKAGIKL